MRNNKITKLTLVLSLLTFYSKGVVPQTGGMDLIENVVVARSYRESQQPAGEFCAQEKVGFTSNDQTTHFSFWAVQISGNDGVVNNPKTAEIGFINTCFGQAPNEHIHFYGEGELNGISFKGKGLCMGNSDGPEPGINLNSCFLDFLEVPPGYMGGRLTTNTLNSRTQVGEITDPPGYTQQSIATVRIWRLRDN